MSSLYGFEYQFCSAILIFKVVNQLKRLSVLEFC